MDANLPADRRREALRLRGEGLTLAQVGAALGVTKERARQLLLPRPERSCKGCGKVLDLPRVQYHAGCRPAPPARPAGRPRPVLSEATCQACGATFLRRDVRQAVCTPACRTGRGRQLDDLRGRPFGLWTVLDAPAARRGRHTLWRCRCRCGTCGFVPADKLLAGASTRCRRCTLGATWPKSCPACGREYLGTTRQVYCSPRCRPAK